MGRGEQYLEDERVIGAFLNNFRMVDIVRESGLSKATCYRIKNNPKFQKIIQKRKEEYLKTAVNKMQSYLIKDVEILQQIIESDETSPQTKVNAIQTLMNQLRDWTTTTDIMKRLEALQEASGNDLRRLGG